MSTPHLYIHVPFCAGKCHYCAFYSEKVFHKSLLDEYPGLLLRELRLRARVSRPLCPQTIYMGGGTPSLLGASGFIELTKHLRGATSFSRLQEWSVEINPASATGELFKVMRGCGVNRVTFGAQSFNNSVLSAINRGHNAQRAINSVASARDSGFTNIGLDLIAGLPGVDRVGWQSDLATALSLAPRHISVYALSVEQGTKMARMVERGVAVADADEQLERLRQAEEILTAAGFRRYEISNYALPGYECEHNLGVWRGNDYIGIGPAAASRIKQRRLENRADLKHWREELLKGGLPPHSQESLSAEDDALERVLFRLRLREGFNPDECQQRFAALRRKSTEWERTLKRLTAHGALKERRGRWQLTARGRELCDYVIRELM